MKEPYLGTPVEDDIRRHFGKALHPDKEIEVVPHTKVWATTSGVLLWDPKNGYADINAEPGFKNSNIVTSELQQVVYLTGPAGSGKTLLVDLMREALELNRASFFGFVDLSRELDKHQHYKTIVVTNNSTVPTAFNLAEALRIWCRERKIKFHRINLTNI